MPDRFFHITRNGDRLESVLVSFVPQKPDIRFHLNSLTWNTGKGMRKPDSAGRAVHKAVKSGKPVTGNIPLEEACPMSDEAMIAYLEKDSSVLELVEKCEREGRRLFYHELDRAVPVLLGK